MAPNPITYNKGGIYRYVDYVSQLPEFLRAEDDVVVFLQVLSDYINNAYRNITVIEQFKFSFTCVDSNYIAVQNKVMNLINLFKKAEVRDQKMLYLSKPEGNRYTTERPFIVDYINYAGNYTNNTLPVDIISTLKTKGDKFYVKFIKDEYAKYSGVFMYDVINGAEVLIPDNTATSQDPFTNTQNEPFTTPLGLVPRILQFNVKDISTIHVRPAKTVNDVIYYDVFFHATIYNVESITSIHNIEYDINNDGIKDNILIDYYNTIQTLSTTYEEQLFIKFAEDTNTFEWNSGYGRGLFYAREMTKEYASQTKNTTVLKETVVDPMYSLTSNEMAIQKIYSNGSYITVTVTGTHSFITGDYIYITHTDKFNGKYQILGILSSNTFKLNPLNNLSHSEVSGVVVASNLFYSKNLTNFEKSQLKLIYTLDESSGIDTITTDDIFYRVEPKIQYDDFETAVDCYNVNVPLNLLTVYDVSGLSIGDTVFFVYDVGSSISMLNTNSPYTIMDINPETKAIRLNVTLTATGIGTARMLKTYLYVDASNPSDENYTVNDIENIDVGDYVRVTALSATALPTGFSENNTYTITAVDKENKTIEIADIYPTTLTTKFRLVKYIKTTSYGVVDYQNMNQTTGDLVLSSHYGDMISDGHFVKSDTSLIPTTLIVSGISVAWNNATRYKTGTYVTYNNIRYRTLIDDNKGIVPTTEKYFVVDMGDVQQYANIVEYNPYMFGMYNTQPIAYGASIDYNKGFGVLGNSMFIQQEQDFALKYGAYQREFVYNPRYATKYKTSRNGYMEIIQSTGTNVGGIGTQGLNSYYIKSFTNGDLDAGILTLTHNLNSIDAIINVTDNNNKIIIPDDTQIINYNQVTLDLTGFGTITGTWNVMILIAGELQTTTKLASSYMTPFTNFDLVAGILTITHDLNSTDAIVSITDDYGKVIIPNDVQIIDGTQITVDLNGFDISNGHCTVLVLLDTALQPYNHQLTASYIQTFTNFDLVSGILTITHGLGSVYSIISITDNNRTVVIPNDINIINNNQITVDLTGFGIITGTWNVIVLVAGDLQSETQGNQHDAVIGDISKYIDASTQEPMMLYGSTINKTFNIRTIRKTGGIVTVVLDQKHGYETGIYVTINGIIEPEYNGRYQITILSPNSFTYSISDLATGIGNTSVSTVSYSNDIRCVVEHVTSVHGSNGTVVKVTTSTDHGYNINTIVTISGCNEVDYNGTYPITSVPTSNSFIYIISGIPSSPATGTSVYSTYTPKVDDYVNVISQLNTYQNGVYVVTDTNWTLYDQSKISVPFTLFSRLNLFGPDTINTAVATDDSIYNVKAITRVSNIVTVLLYTPHTYFTGNTVVISGATDSAYNGKFIIESISNPLSFTYKINTNATPITPATPLNSDGITAVIQKWYKFDISEIEWQQKSNFDIANAGNAITNLFAKSSVMTVHTYNPHGYVAGQYISIKGTANTEFINSYKVYEVVNDTTFTTIISPSLTGSEITGYTYSGTIIESNGNNDNVYALVGEYSYTKSDDTIITFTDGDIVELRDQFIPSENGTYRVMKRTLWKRLDKRLVMKIRNIAVDSYENMDIDPLADVPLPYIYRTYTDEDVEQYIDANFTIEHQIYKADLMYILNFNFSYEVIENLDTTALSYTDLQYDSRYDYNSITPRNEMNPSFIGVPDMKYPLVEKFNRLMYLKDPKVIDFSMIEYLARLMGYDITELKNDIDESVVYKTDEQRENALRETIQNLPQFYALKGTKSSMEMIMLAFGIVGEVINKWTKQSNPYNELIPDYELKGATLTENIDKTGDTFISTPHFSINVELESNSNNQLMPNDTRRIVSQINRIKPINTVFDGIYNFISAKAYAGMSMSNMRSTARMTSAIGYETLDFSDPNVNTDCFDNSFWHIDGIINMYLTNASIDEEMPSSTLIGYIMGSDQSGNQLTYTLPIGVVDNSQFSISGNSLLSNAVFHYSTISSYIITIRATSPNGSVYDETFTITINSIALAPTDLTLSNQSIDENTAINYTIGTFTGIDPNIGDVLTYSLPIGLNDNDKFNIFNGNQLRNSYVFNHETISSYTITGRVSDNGGLYHDEIFTITVNDLNETPTDISLTSNTMDEGTDIGTTIATLIATDPDVGDTFTFSLPVSGGDNDNFSISGTSLKNAIVFDYNTQASYTITIRVTDAHGLYYDKSVTIYINQLFLALELTTTTPNQVVTLHSVDGINKTIDWGDGTIETISSVPMILDMISDSSYSHTYVNSGVYNLSTNGSFIGQYQAICSPRSVITGAISWGNKLVRQAGSMFAQCSNLSSLPSSWKGLEDVTNTSYMFLMCPLLTDIPSTWNGLTALTNASNMFNSTSIAVLPTSWSGLSALLIPDGMFYYCSTLTTIPTSWTGLSTVTGTHNMFNGCTALTAIPNTSNAWSALSSVTNTDSMFAGCPLLTSIPSTWAGLEQVTNTSSMFFGCVSLTAIPHEWTELGSVGSMYAMFSGCTSLTTIATISNTWNGLSSVTDMERVFSGCTSLTTIPSTWTGLSTVQDMFAAFAGTAITSIPNSWSALTVLSDASLMFRECTSLTTIPSSWSGLSALTDANEMFQYCASLTTIPSSWSGLSALTDANEMFRGCGLTAIPSTWTGLPSITNTSAMMYGCHALTTIPTSWSGLDNVTSAQYMFRECIALTALPSSWSGLDKVINMRDFCYGCTSLVTIGITDLTSLSKVNSIGYAFSGDTNITSDILTLYNYLSTKSSPVVAFYTDCFTNCTSANGYAFVPTAWGGLA